MLRRSLTNGGEMSFEELFVYFVFVMILSTLLVFLRRRDIARTFRVGMDQPNSEVWRGKVFDGGRLSAVVASVRRNPLAAGPSKRMDSAQSSRALQLARLRVREMAYFRHPQGVSSSDEASQRLQD